MKFAIAVVILAVAVAAQAAYLPLAYSNWAAPAAYGAYGSYADGLIAPRVISSAAYPYSAYPYSAYPYSAPFTAPYAAPYAAPLAYSAPAVIGAPLEASYVAANRGSVHVAPLPGHTESTSSINLQPAPGTL